MLLTTNAVMIRQKDHQNLQKKSLQCKTRVQFRFSSVYTTAALEQGGTHATLNHQHVGLPLPMPFLENPVSTIFPQSCSNSVAWETLQMFPRSSEYLLGFPNPICSRFFAQLSHYVITLLYPYSCMGRGSAT